MASGKTKSIEEIDDIPEMFKTMAALGISCRGLQTLDQMKSRVRAELKQVEYKPTWTAGQVRMIYTTHACIHTQMHITRSDQDVCYHLGKRGIVQPGNVHNHLT